MSTVDADLASSQQMPATQRPRDAATLILVRREGAAPRILLGRRHGGHAFMPNMYVFPGGRLDAADCRMRFDGDLDPAIAQRLVARMRGRPSLARARGLALAAVRETFEEVGLILGKPLAAPFSAPSPDWQAFTATGFLPDLSSLRFVMRAITPPGRTRRFDTRFFIADAAAVHDPDRPQHAGSGELLEARWFTLSEALGLDLPRVTRDVLERLDSRLRDGGWPAATDPVPFQYYRHGKWREDPL
jgi:8-oxo-dGTP pyrophosphatase MutT (NUDIX family)